MHGWAFSVRISKIGSIFPLSRTKLRHYFSLDMWFEYWESTTMRQLQDLQHQLHLQRDKDFWDIQTLFLRNPSTKLWRVSIQSTISVKKKNWMTMIMTTPLVCFTLSFSWAWYRNSSSTKSSSLKTRTVLWSSLTNFKDVQWVELSFFPLCGKAMSPDGSCDGSCPIMCILRQAPTCLTWVSL